MIDLHQKRLESANKRDIIYRLKQMWLDQNMTYEINIITTLSQSSGCTQAKVEKELRELNKW